LYSLSYVYIHFKCDSLPPEDGGSKVVRNFGNLPHNYTPLQSKRTRFGTVWFVEWLDEFGRVGMNIWRNVWWIRKGLVEYPSNDIVRYGRWGYLDKTF